MTEGDWERAVREQVGLGRLLPLGAADDGAWIAERAAAGALRRAAAVVRGARVTGLRVGLDGDAEDAGGGGAGPGVGPAPVSALPYGELRISAECDAAVDRPMTATAEALREALLRGAEERLGLRVAAVDVHVAGLLETPQPAARPDPPEQGTGTGTGTPGVPGLLDIDTLPDGDHAELRVVVDSAHRALDVARTVRAGADAATVTVLVTDIR
ncbi:hypothetical protein ACHZ98_01970 [Streptomyces sp. MAR4 CNY-716]